VVVCYSDKVGGFWRKDVDSEGFMRLYVRLWMKIDEQICEIEAKLLTIHEYTKIYLYEN